MDTDNRGLVTYAVDIYGDDCYITTMEDFSNQESALTRATTIYGGKGFKYKIFKVVTERELKGEGTL